MTGVELKQAREGAGWTQARLGRRLRVSQAYVSMLERKKRTLPKRLQTRLLGLLTFSPLSFPFRGQEHWIELDDSALAEQLANLGYPGFAYLRRIPEWNPAELLVAALSRPSLEARVAEALPWLIFHYSQVNWEWITLQAKLRDVQNRLGFATTLARELAEKTNVAKVAHHLSQVEDELKKSLLAGESTFCRDHMTHAERRWLRSYRTPEACEWNILSNLTTEHLSHAI